MPTTQLAPSRASETNPNHHLWKNGRLWWLAVTLLHDGLAAFQNYRPLIFGAILIACMLFMPGGMTRALARVAGR